LRISWANWLLVQQGSLRENEKPSGPSSRRRLRARHNGTDHHHFPRAWACRTRHQAAGGGTRASEAILGRTGLGGEAKASGCTGKPRPCTRRGRRDSQHREKAEGSWLRSSTISNCIRRRHRAGAAPIRFHRSCRTVRPRRGEDNLEAGPGRRRTTGTNNTAKGRDGVHLGCRKKNRAAEDRPPRERTITTEEP
jgi:hypothetical protein